MKLIYFLIYLLFPTHCCAKPPFNHVLGLFSDGENDTLLRGNEVRGMLHEKINKTSSLLTGLFFIILGTLFFTQALSLWILIWILSIIGFAWIGLNTCYSYFIQHRKRKAHNYSPLLPGLVSIGMAIYTGFNPMLFTRFIHYAIGWWALLNGLVQAVNFYVYRKDCLKGTGTILAKVIIDILFSIFLMVRPINKLWIVSYLAGSYLILYGLITLIESLKDVMSPAINQKVMHHLRLPVPVFISMLIPQRIFVSITALIKTNKLNPDSPIKDQETDLEIFIYLKESGPESLGHVDIAFDGKIYSYGCHDPRQRRLMGTLGDGVLIVADRQQFLKHALKYEDKTIVGYGISLSDKHKEIIHDRIKNMMVRSIPWQSDAELLELGLLEECEAKDYASRVYRSTHGFMYKFTQGRFKTYFVGSTNCVLLADTLFRCKDLDLIPLSGIVTPGTYLEFLNTEYQRPASVVINRTIYKRTHKKSSETFTSSASLESE